jgi:hypothetical protein
MPNLHPEYAALSAILLHLIITACRAYGIDVDASTQGDLTILIMWAVIRVSRKIDPPATEDLQRQITKNIEAGK